jgi:uncharacterized protein YajQ (UPF0234 family)
VPSFDIVSEIDRQELRNAIDQAQRELATRFDFKNTNSEIDQKELVLTLSTVSEDRLRALRTLLEEKLVKRKLSLKGIDSDKAREINRLIKEKGPKGVSSQSQGQQIRVTGKKRDDLQTVMSLLRESDLGIPLQFENFRD